MVRSMGRGFRADRSEMSIGAACLRAVRSTSLVTMRSTWRTLLANRAFRRHVAAISATDMLFFVSHRHYLVRGLSAPQRAALALHHYEHETNTFDEPYLDAVYGGRGLLLWRTSNEEVQVELRLEHGSDVLDEGGLSIVLYVDGGRVCVLSLSHVDADIIFGRTDPAVRGRAPTGSTIFITRKQLAANHAYQERFNPLVHRCHPAHLCMAALDGMARVLGHTSVAAVRPEAHPGYKPERHDRFQHAYAEFWDSLYGKVRGPYAYEILVPMAMRPLEELRSKARRRARLRRSCLAEIRRGSEGVLRARLRRPRLRCPTAELPRQLD